MRLGDAITGLQGVDKSGYTQPNTVLLTEPGVYTFLLRCGQPEAEPFMEWVVEEVLPREVRKLAEIVEEKDTALALLEDRDRQLMVLGDDLEDKDRQLAVQAQEIAGLRERCVPHAQDPRKDNVIMIYRKHTTQDEEKYHHLPYYCPRIQRGAIPKKRRWFRDNFPNSEEIVVIDNPNCMHAFNRFECGWYVGRYQCHFRLIDLTQDDLYDLGVPALED